MREIDKIREILASLSTPDLTLRESRGNVEMKRAGKSAGRLPLKVIRDRAPEAAGEASAGAFNVFINAGARLTAVLREGTLDGGGVATSTGLLRIKTDRFLVHVERAPALPAPSRRGPKLQGKSELVAEGLLVAIRAADLPPLERLAALASGRLEDEGALSIAQTQKVVARLVRDRLLEVDRSRGPKFTRYFGVRREELLRTWADEYMPGVTRSELYVTARDPRSVVARLKKARLAGRWAVSGPSAAQIWRPTLVPDPPIELWVDEIAGNDIRRLGSVADAGVANLTVRRLAGRQLPLWFAHHQVRNGVPIVSPARAFVETSRSRGPRFDELADALLEAIV